MLAPPNTPPVHSVSSVRLLSPFRYPGGKTWLVPLVFRWLDTIGFAPATFIEPFAGGAIVGLSVAYNGLAQHVTLAEIDEGVGAVWETIITKGEGTRLANAILAFDLTPESVRNTLINTCPDVFSRAFQTIVRNRVSRGGILAEGSGLLNRGENGKGLSSRWYPQTLAKRIQRIDRIRERLSFVWGDGLAVIEQNRHRSDAVFFIDPPYTVGNGKKAGRRLYRHSELDHRHLFDLMKNIQGMFLMTYENHRDMYAMATQHGFSACPVRMRNTHHTTMTELLIGRDLTWIGQSRC